MPLPSAHVVTADEFAATYNVKTFQSIGGCTLSIASTTITDITGASVSWTKIGSSSQSSIIFQASASCKTSVANDTVDIFVNINGVDTAVTYKSLNTTNHETLPTGWVEIAGVPAGTYTVKLRSNRGFGSGTITIDASDTVSFRIEEKLL